MFSRLTIKTRLVATMASMAAVLLLCSGLGLSGMRAANGALQGLYTDQLQSADQIERSLTRLLQARLALHRILMHPDAPAAPQLLQRAQDFALQSSQAWQAYLKLPMGSEEKRLAGEVASARAAYLRDGTEAAIAALRTNRRMEAETIMYTRMAPLFDTLDASVERLLRFQYAEAGQAYRASQARYRNYLGIAAAALAATLASVLASAFILVRSIHTPLQRALQSCAAIARGDLSGLAGNAAEPHNEMGRLMHGLQRMRGGLRDTVHDIREASEAISTASRQIAAGNQDLSSRTERQAASLQETASSLETLAVAVRRNAGNAHETSRIAAGVADAASRGGAAVSGLVGTIGAIREASQRIADIIGLIDSLAFQTNILSLNAAVEAARAGEQGRGFAVVAAEVRVLAQRSAGAAREIRALIEDASGKVDAGSSQAAHAGASIAALVDSVREVDRMLAEIAAASQAQNEGIAQINQEVNHMDLFTQQNAALVEEAAAAALALHEQAGVLLRTVEVFKLES